jgi:hypothetical protein
MPFKRQRKTWQTGDLAMCQNRGWSDAATARYASSHQKPRGQERTLLVPFTGAQSYRHLDFRLLFAKDKLLLFSASRFGVRCYSGARKLICHPLPSLMF